MNTSNKDRRLLLFQFRTADAWPLVALPKSIEDYDALMVAGVSTLEPRLTPVPVRLPLPPADKPGLDLREPERHGQPLLRHPGRR